MTNLYNVQIGQTYLTFGRCTIRGDYYSNDTLNLNLLQLKRILTDYCHHSTPVDALDLSYLAGALVYQAWYANSWVAILNQNNPKNNSSTKQIKGPRMMQPTIRTQSDKLLPIISRVLYTIE